MRAGEASPLRGGDRRRRELEAREPSPSLARQSGSAAWQGHCRAPSRVAQEGSEKRGKTRASVSGKVYGQFLEILEDRHGHGATFITSPFPMAQWHEMITDPTVADAILVRLAHDAYRLQFAGKSMGDPKNPADKHS